MAIAPFDHDRRCASVLVDGRDGRTLITKGALESVLDRCTGVADDARRVLDTEFAAGNRVVAVASRPATELSSVTPADEHDLVLAGYLTFLDQPKASASESIARLAELGVTVKIVTAAPRRCGHLGRHRDRRRERRRRHHPVGTRPRCARRRCRRRPPHLRQHHQVRPHGHVVELREHVQRHRRGGVPSLSCPCSRHRSCSTTCCTTPAR